MHWKRGLGLIVAATIAACSADGGELPGGSSGCEAGATQTCACPDGGTGTQTCSADAGQLGACVCGATPRDASADGAGGAGGSAGSGGAAGSGGTGGVGGAGGRDGGPPRDGGGGGGGGGGGPTTCTVDADCQAAGVCPSDATLGCGCKINPQGQGKCAPRCATSADCAPKAGETMICKSDGFCAPDRDAGPPPNDGAPPPNDGAPPPGDGGQDASSTDAAADVAIE